MQNIDIEAIMREIRREIREDPAFQQPLTLEEVPSLAETDNTVVMGGIYDEELLCRHVGEMGAHFAVPYYRPIEGRRAKTFFKRVLRKLMCFLLRPALEEVSAFHAMTASSMNAASNFIREQEAENQRRDRRIAELEKRIAALRREENKQEELS